ncbi:unnamed protein product [Euphydryas editha]|uniref:Uncharacterized protein n=1 Tax=Euphydryas editha TaxID=104508 RepID=A0AAU9TSZ3_EUPED|nr:unnamed protein product [Euphydryas editha]
MKSIIKNKKQKQSQGNGENVRTEVQINMEQLTRNTSTKAGNQMANRERISSVPTSTSDQTQIERRGTKINDLVDYIKDKNNVDGEIRRLVKSIETRIQPGS